MPAETVTDTQVPEVSITKTEAVLPTQQELSDAQASAKLSLYFNRYHTLRKDKPKFPSETEVMRAAIIHGEDAADSLISEATKKFTNWAGRMAALVRDFLDVGKTNPGAHIAVIGGKTGRPIQANGILFYNAVLRTDSDVLSGTLR